MISENIAAMSPPKCNFKIDELKNVKKWQSVNIDALWCRFKQTSPNFVCVRLDDYI